MIINLWGAPGAGKSFKMAQMFLDFKRLGKRAVMHPEPQIIQAWVNTGCWNRDELTRRTQQQHRDMLQLEEDCPGIFQITDHPVAIDDFYSPSPELWALDAAQRRVCDVRDSWVGRYDRPYDPKGRVQSEAEADVLADRMWRDLFSRGIIHDGGPD